jgi:hypothetical protein
MLLVLRFSIFAIIERLRGKLKAQVAEKWRVRGGFVLRTWMLSVERAIRDLDEILRVQRSNMLTKKTKRPSHTPCIVSNECDCLRQGETPSTKIYVAPEQSEARAVSEIEISISSPSAQ